MWLILIVIGIIILLRLPGKYKLKPENFPGIAPSSFQEWKSMDILSDQTYLAGLAVGFVAATVLIMYGDDWYGEGGSLVGALIAIVAPLIPGRLLGVWQPLLKRNTELNTLRHQIQNRCTIHHLYHEGLLLLRPDREDRW